MSAEYSPFARPKFTADDFARKESEDASFDSTPIHPAENRSFTAGADATETFVASESLRDEEVLLTDRVDNDASAFAATPVYASTTNKSSGRAIHPIALVAVPAVAVLAGVAFFAMQPRDTGVAELTPGSTATVATPAPAAPQIATATPAPTTMTPQTAVPAATPATPRVSARVETPARVARARPAPASAASADTAAADAAATLPAAPIPYSASAQTPGAAPAPIVVPPVTAAAPVTASPEAATPVPEPSTPESAAPEAAQVPIP
jgi:hypothetical protein